MEEFAFDGVHYTLNASFSKSRRKQERDYEEIRGAMQLRKRHLMKVWKRKQEAYKARQKEEAAAAAKKK